MKPIAFATCVSQPDLSADDALAAAAVEAHLGTEVRAVPWNLPGIRWQDFSAVVLRSTWDYHRQLAAFGGWLVRLAACGAPVFNPVPLLTWNLSKTYLRGLAAGGVSIVPTVWVPQGDCPLLAGLLGSRGWQRAVVKPAVSAAAFGTWTVETGAPSAALDARFKEQCLQGEMMVQPFLEEIVLSGEWSLILIGGTYSHSVRKRPAQNEFRVQSQHGGSWECAEPPPSLIVAANHILRLVAASRSLPFYARVDLVEVNHAPGYYLMEFELIEPVLFFGADGAAADLFANALSGRLAECTSTARPSPI